MIKNPDQKTLLATRDLFYSNLQLRIKKSENRQKYLESILNIDLENQSIGYWETMIIRLKNINEMQIRVGARQVSLE